MTTMVDWRVSTLNPNAPVFDPVGFREVEDFSPRWWELVTTSKWFRDFWLSSNSEDKFGGGEFSDMEEELDDLIISSDEAKIGGSTRFDSVTESMARCLKALLSITESRKGKLYRSNVSIPSCSQKYNQKKTNEFMNTNLSCRRNRQIYQPR